MNPDRTKLYLDQHHEFMKHIEKILYFISALEIGVLGFAGLDETAGILGVFSVILLFYAYAFWFVFSHYVSSNIQHTDFYRNSKSDDQALLHQRDFKLKTDISAGFLIFLVFGAFLFLLCALLDHFILKALVPAIPPSICLWIAAILFLSLFLVWAYLYLPLTKTVEDYGKKSILSHG